MAHDAAAATMRLQSSGMTFYSRWVTWSLGLAKSERQAARLPSAAAAAVRTHSSARREHERRVNNGINTNELAVLRHHCTILQRQPRSHAGQSGSQGHGRRVIKTFLHS